MMADLVHQHVLDDRAERLIVLGPVIKDRPPVEPDHVRHLDRVALGRNGRPTPWNKPSKSNSLSAPM